MVELGLEPVANNVMCCDELHCTQSVKKKTNFIVLATNQGPKMGGLISMKRFPKILN